MPEILKPAPGSFCWVEHASADPAAAQAFYGALFGWTFTPAHTMSDGSRYVMAQLKGVNVGGFTTLQGKAVPTRWRSYIAVDDARATLSAAAAQGAQTLMDAEDVGDGVIALLKDPTGAPLVLIQSRRSLGPWLYGEMGAASWSELLTTDLELARRFYAGVFAWDAEVARVGTMPYVVFSGGGDVIGGMAPAPKDHPNGWILYFRVPDAADALARALAAGAGVSVPVTDWGGVGRWALLKDPSGAPFGILQPP
jgi:predicted enzyme related to lactoylglutathione lyase